MAEETTPARTMVHVRLPADLVAKIDAWGDKRGISRSAAIAVLLSERLGVNGHTEGGDEH